MPNSLITPEQMARDVLEILDRNAEEYGVDKADLALAVWALFNGGPMVMGNAKDSQGGK